MDGCDSNDTQERNPNERGNESEFENDRQRKQR